MNSKVKSKLLAVFFVVAFVLVILYSSAIAEHFAALAQFVVKIMLDVNWWESIV